MFMWKYGRIMPCFAPDSGADSGTGASSGESADGATATGETSGAAEPNYKALYLKLKPQFDRTASEVAELKKAQKATMTEQQVKEAENAEKEQRYQEMAAKVAEMETASLFAENGFDKNDYGEVSAKLVEVGGEKAGELAESIIAFVKKANATAVANAKNALIKDGAYTPKTSTAKANEHTYAQMAFESNQPSNRTQEIKDYYKKK